MSFTSTFTTLVAAGTEGVDLVAPTWVFGVSVFACFMVLLGVLWSFRNTAAKYDQPATSTASHGDMQRSHGSRGSQGSHGATDHGAHH
jgi:hypothetical protein